MVKKQLPLAEAARPLDLGAQAPDLAGQVAALGGPLRPAARGRGTEAIADDYEVSLDRDDDFDRWFVPLLVYQTTGAIVPGYSFGSFIADDPDGNTTVIMMTATGGDASVDGGLSLTVEGTIRAQQGLEVADGTFVASFQ